MAGRQHSIDKLLRLTQDEAKMLAIKAKDAGLSESACHTHKCVRVMTFKNFTEGMIVAGANKEGKYFV